MSELGKKIKELRGEETLRDAAARIGVSHTYLSLLEKGNDPRTNKPIKPTPDTLKIISSAYNYPYKKLLKLAGILDEDSSEELKITQTNNHGLSLIAMDLVEQIEKLPIEKQLIIQDIIQAYGVEKNKK